MNKKYFKDSIFLLVVFPPYILAAFLLGVYFLFSCCKIIVESEPFMYSIDDIKALIYCVPSGIFLFVASLWMLFSYMGDRLDILCVTPRYVRWRCLLRRTRILNFSDCIEIGVETFYNELKHRPIYRGDENAMIYFTTEPLPEKYKGHINHARCNAQLIKFPYSDKLTEALLEVLPPERKANLDSFYHRMKNFDYQVEQARKQRKRRKKK